MRNKLFNLIARNKGAGAGLRINAAADGSEATIYVYDQLVASEVLAEWVGGVAPGPFVRELQALDVDTIHLRINSPGGDVFAARPMQQALREHPARIVTHIDGYAASAATLLALAGEEVRMAPGGFFMIHNAWSWAVGNAEEFMSVADLLEKVDGTLREDYMAKTGLGEDAVRAYMDDETWFTADEALDAGFVDHVEERAAASASAKEWDLSAYAHAPKRAAADPEQDPGPAAKRHPTQHMRNRIALLNKAA